MVGGIKGKKIRKQVTILEAHPGPKKASQRYVLWVQGTLRGPVRGDTPTTHSVLWPHSRGGALHLPGVRGGLWWLHQLTAEGSGRQLPHLP